MVKENYFDSTMQEIKELQERIIRSEKSLSRSDNEIQLMFQDETKNHAQMCAEYREMEAFFLQSNRQKMKELEEKLKTMCSCDFNYSIEFISYVLSNVENKKYEIIRENGTCTVKPVGDNNPNDIISFDKSDRIDLFKTELMDESSNITKRYPYLTDVIMSLIYYKTNIFNSYLNDEQIFNYMYMIFPIDYSHLLSDSSNKMDERLKLIAQDLASDITRGNNFSSNYRYGVPIEEGKTFFEALKSGKYNSILKNEYWFGDNISPRVLTRWNSKRVELENKGQTCGNISIENYKVYATLDDLIKHLEDIKESGSYNIRLNGQTQTPATEEEQAIVYNLLDEVLKRNYNWREAREIVRNVNRLSIYTDHKFPHNVERIIEAFNPKVVTYYDKIEETVDLKSDLNDIKKRALEIARDISAENLPHFFLGKSKDNIDEYLRRMILSQFDIPKLVHKSNKHPFDEKLGLVSEELSDSTSMSQEICGVLFSDRQNNKELVDLARGTLLSLCYDKKIDNILNLCIETQENLNCWCGTVGQNDINSLRLPNGDILYSTYCDDIKPQYKRFQQEYELYYNSDNDLEFVEGCSEVFGNILISQIFREGNKRTAKCLFNSMLVSRGIVPPFADLNENESALWNEFADGRFDRFPDSRAKLLMQAIDVNKKMKEPDFSAPINVPLEAVSRAEFKSRSY